MRTLLTCLLAVSAGPAQAMNWEGHDDWMAELAPASVYRNALPEAHPPPPQPCSAARSRSAENSYEQIPLGGPDCRGSKEERETDR